MKYCKCGHPVYGIQYSPDSGGPCGMPGYECKEYKPENKPTDPADESKPCEFCGETSCKDAECEDDY